MSTSIMLRTKVEVGDLTNNLVLMAKEAGLYEALYQPELKNIRCAGELIDFLEFGLGMLRNNPEHFRGFEPKNGWGTYESLVEFVERYLDLCRQHPDMEVWHD